MRKIQEKYYARSRRLLFLSSPQQSTSSTNGNERAISWRYRLDRCLVPEHRIHSSVLYVYVDCQVFFSYTLVGNYQPVIVRMLYFFEYANSTTKDDRENRRYIMSLKIRPLKNIIRRKNCDKFFFFNSSIWSRTCWTAVF